ncbi:MAG: CPBP family intramembrane metalloprotease [Planctomycetaceae bacterium]|nr:CPBP family intramembrane metalloprotease [Planctomycetaceae bacterium]
MSWIAPRSSQCRGSLRDPTSVVDRSAIQWTVWVCSGVQVKMSWFAPRAIGSQWFALRTKTIFWGMHNVILVLLLVISLIAWVLTFCCWGRVQRIWYGAGNKKFLKQPNLDVGIVFLLFCANLLAMSSLGWRWIDQQFGGAASAPKAETVTSSAPVEDQADQKTDSDKTDIRAKPPTVSNYASAWGLGLVVMGVMVWTSHGLYGTRLFSWGCGAVGEGKLLATLVASWLAFFLLVPPVLLIHEVATLLIPYEHATIHSMSQWRAEREWLAVGLTFLNTACWTPLVEEFGFRVVVQGFLEQYFTHRRNFLRWVLGPLQLAPAKLFGLEQAAGVANRVSSDAAPRAGWGTWRFWAPVVISSFLFAFAHYGQGPAPLPLYVLGLGLGFLYKTTGNLGLCVLIHAYLNGLTLTRLLLS